MILKLVPTKAAPADLALIRAYDQLVLANEELAQATGEDMCVRATGRYADALEAIADTPAATTVGLIVQARALLESADLDREGTILAVDEGVASTLARGVLRLLAQEQRP